MKKLVKKIFKGLLVIAGCTITLFSNQAAAQTLKTKKMNKKILFVVSSHDKKGNTGEATGY